MFKASLQDIGVLKDSLEAISSLISEGNFKISKEGIKLIAMDPASVAMVILDVLPSAFLNYDCDNEHEITLSLPNFVTILKRAKASDTITLELIKDKLKITMQGDYKRTFSLPLIINPSGEQKIPELNFKGKIELDSDVLKEGIKDASMVSDCAIFSLTPEKFIISSSGDVNETKLELTKDSPSLISIQFLDQETREIKSKYSIDYLDKILKGTKVSNVVSLQFSTDYPMRLDCTAVNKLRLSFILAPRVDTE